MRMNDIALLLLCNTPCFCAIPHDFIAKRFTKMPNAPACNKLCILLCGEIRNKRGADTPYAYRSIGEHDPKSIRGSVVAFLRKHKDNFCVFFTERLRKIVAGAPKPAAIVRRELPPEHKDAHKTHYRRDPRPGDTATNEVV